MFGYAIFLLHPNILPRNDFTTTTTTTSCSLLAFLPPLSVSSFVLVGQQTNDDFIRLSLFERRVTSRSQFELEQPIAPQTPLTQPTTKSDTKQDSIGEKS